MILSFKPQFHEKILDGSKIHTIRGNPKRWAKGYPIHFATGIRTKNYNCFKEGTCMSVQDFKIYWRGNKVYPVSVFIDGREINLDEQYNLAINDGFDTVDKFYEWFNEDFIGIIIHWTDYQY